MEDKKSILTDTFGFPMYADTISEEAWAEISSLVIFQSGDCINWLGLLLYYKGSLWMVIRDKYQHYDLIELDYLSN